MSDFSTSIQAIKQIAIKANQRQLVPLVGSSAWLMKQAKLLIDDQAYFWIGDAPDGVVSHQYKQLLGLECALLIINAEAHFDANAFAAAEGTLKGGGLLVLLTSDYEQNRTLFDLYVQQELDKTSFVQFKEGDSDLASKFPLTKMQVSTASSQNFSQQKMAIEAIIKTVTGHRRRPLVLTANRGRGKSAALGFAAKALAKSGVKTIFICAPNKQATGTFFKHAGDSANITFIAPDLLLETKPPCDLLMIDEAAALPVPMLEALTKHYSRLVFSTTMHGYEGSGRGFALCFHRILKRLAPEFRECHLDQPIRWAENDPLESFTLNSLCLTEFNQSDPCYDKHQNVDFIQLTAQQLLNNKALLKSVFSLLVTAHYQTKPSDLEMLLNEHDLSIFTLQQNNQILGVALVNREGQLDDVLAEEIFKGTRRIKGNLVPQSIAFHCGFKTACSQSFARIQRIAISPTLQNNRLGHLFITHIRQWAKLQGFDHLCSAFGATAQLTRFWTDQFFSPLRIGTTKDKSSGTFSIIMNASLSDQGDLLSSEVFAQFQDQLSFYLSRHLQTLDPLIVSLLLTRSLVNTNYQVPALLQSYLSGNLQYQYVEYALIQLLQSHNLFTLPLNQQKLFILKVLQNQNWIEVSQQLGFTGKKQAQQALKTAIQQLIGNKNEIR